MRLATPCFCAIGSHKQWRISQGNSTFADAKAAILQRLREEGKLFRKFYFVGTWASWCLAMPQTFPPDAANLRWRRNAAHTKPTRIFLLWDICILYIYIYLWYIYVYYLHMHTFLVLPLRLCIDLSFTFLAAFSLIRCLPNPAPPVSWPLHRWVGQQDSDPIGHIREVGNGADRTAGPKNGCFQK